MDDQQLIREFVVEASEHLADVENQLLSIESSSSNVNLDVVHEVFRNVHSMKGAASFLGLQAIGDLSHHLESVLNLIRNRELVPTGEVIEALLGAFDTLRQLVHHVDSQQDFDIAQHLVDLQRFTDEASPHRENQPASPSVAPNSSAIDPPLSPEAAIAEAVIAQAQALVQTTFAERKSSTAPIKMSQPDAHIRVPVAILDRLMNLAGELVLGRNQLLRLNQSKCQRQMTSVSSRIDQVTSDLQDAIMSARMQPVATVFNRFPRLVRDVCHKLNREAQLILEGTEVELDKSVLESISDPLTHLIRNAIDHGIEPPAHRVAVGKSAEGTVTLRAYHQGGKVHITVADDGGGIDPEKLKAKAIRKGIITAEQAKGMNDREAVRLIFHPGFSTAEVVTEVSGRGVGMDVVKTNIEKLGGSVEIESTPNRGTTVSVRLPLTLAIIPSLIVESCRERYAIPESAIVELVRVISGDTKLRIERFKSAEALRLRNELLPLVRLSKLMADRSSSVPEKTVASSREALNIVVVEASGFRYGIVIDTVLDPEQIVVKPLGAHLKNCGCLSGATVLGDGQVAFILDTAGIASQAKLAASEVSQVGHESESESIANESQTILIFRSQSDSQYAVPMSMVSRIERINRADIKRVGQRLLLEYRGGALPILHLDDDANMDQLPDNIYVLVFQLDRKEVGLAVAHLVDICDVTCDVDTRGSHEQGVMGILVLEGQFVRLLDMYELAGSISARAEGRDRRSHDGEPSNAKRRGTVLLAEDSTFFREQVSRFLEGENLSVVMCEDGLSAWQTLQSGVVKFDLVVTDIEMPNMNGFEFCSRIRSDQRFAKLPVIALTSMSDAKHVRRGAEAGITEYQIKMDRERLLESVRRFFPRSNHAASPI